MAASVDVNAKSLYLLNKYFIRPVLSLNTSVTNLNSSINNSAISLNASVIANTSSITTLNASVITNTSSITTLNTSVTNINISVTNINTSLTNAIDSVSSTALSIGGTNGTSSQSYAGSLTSGTLNIATAITTGNINIGSVTASNQVNIGGVLIGANAINAGTDSNFQIGANISSSISIGSAQTSGVLNIGTNASRTAAINIGNVSNTGVINIETASTASPAINIGTASGTGRIKIANNANTVDIANIRIANNVINNVSPGPGAIVFGGGQTSGNLWIGTGESVARSGQINIATVIGSTCPINIMNGGGATTGGSVNIANGTLQTTTVNIASGTGTGTVTIGNSANTTTINSRNLQIGNNANTSTIVIGPLSQTASLNISTVVNGVRIDSHAPGNNLLLSFGNTPYKVATTGGGTENFCNTAVSNIAFSVNPMTGHHCTAVGHNCLTKNSTGIWNIAIGSDTLTNVTTGSYNTALGGFALTGATTDSNNVAIGYNALANSVASSFASVAVGYQALQTFNNSTGGGNVAVGYQALAGLTTGTGNVAIGYTCDNVPGSGSINTVGNDNTIIGNGASSSGKSNTIVIGKGAHANADNQIIIGRAGGGQSAWFQGSGGLYVNGGPTSILGLSASSITTSGNVTVGGGMVINGTIQTTVSNYNYHNRTVPGWSAFAGPIALPLSVYTGGVVTAGEFVCFSDIRLKNIIQKIKIDDALKFMKNEEILFEWKSMKGSMQTGYKAQDVIKSGFGHLVNIVENKECKEEIDDDGFVSPEGLQFCMNYSAVIPYHGVVIKHLLKENEELKTRLNTIENENITLKNQLTDILLRLNAAGI